MAVIVVTVVVQGMLVPAEERGTLKDWRMLVINDGIFQAIGVISFGMSTLGYPPALTRCRK